MHRNALLALVVLLALDCGTACPQPPGAGSPLPAGVTPPLRQKTAPVPPSSPPDKSLDQLLDELEALQAQKTEIERKEAELIQAIRRKAEKQAERMNKLKIGPGGVTAPGEPDRVGRVLILGVAAKKEKAIRELVKFTPGEVLRYPELEETRARLVKAGYRTPVVEARPGALANTVDVVVETGEMGREEPPVPFRP